MLFSLYKGHDLSFGFCFKRDGHIKTDTDNERKSASSKAKRDSETAERAELSRLPHQNATLLISTHKTPTQEIRGPIASLNKGGPNGAYFMLLIHILRAQNGNL